MEQDAGTVADRDQVFEEELVASLTDRSLHLILLPTEQCNFRCTYCYEDFSVGRMTAETVRGVKRLLERRLDDLEQLNVSWFGGEPMVARAVVEDVSSFVVESVADRPHVRYAADMTTNGYLLDAAKAEGLARLGVRSYQISLDGPREIHDTTRRRADGGASFERIWRNLLSIRGSDLDIRVLLRVHLTPANLPAMRAFLPEVRDTFLDDARFSVRLKPVERMGGPHNDEIDVIAHDMRADVQEELGALIRMPARSAQDSPKEEACYAARPNSLVIRANGTVAKCTVALSDPSNSIGRLTPEGTLEVDNDRLSPWVRGWASGDWDAVKCPYAGLPRSKDRLLQITPASPRTGIEMTGR
ncbi:radical SAM protein [Streptomyces triculaminicus]|uniref:radical SAM protein n=1 Tax=Streptomyces triculaminicus TaxID=2816232 RepID=UPI0033F9777D